jgi:YD repeat-containing protein
LLTGLPGLRTHFQEIAMIDHDTHPQPLRSTVRRRFRLAHQYAWPALAFTTLVGATTAANAQVMPGSGAAPGSGMPIDPGMGSGMPIDPGMGSGSGVGSGSGMGGYCGDGIVSGSEACDSGYANGQPGSCNTTCTAIIPRTPFSDPDSAPVLQSLTHGRVIGTRQYEAVVSLGELPGVGLAPGFAFSIRLRSDGATGACGPACTVLASTAAVTGGAYVISDSGTQRRFDVNGAGYREASPQPGTAFKPATAALVAGKLVVTEADGQLTRTFDASGREITRSTPWGALTLAYDASGRLTSATNAAGATLTATYDASGRIATVTDPTGFAMTVRYAADGHAMSLEGPADGSVTPNLAIGWMGNEVTSLGRLGFSPETINYDRGLVSFVRDVDGTAYAFDSNPTLTVVADSSLQYRRATYVNQRVTMIETNGGSQVSYTRDAFGRVTSTHYATGTGELVESMTYDADGHVTSATDTDGGITRMTYDAQGNLTATTDPAGRTTQFSYLQGRLVSTTDPLGRVTSQTYDSNGLPTSTTALGVTVSTTYTARGQAATTTGADGVTTTFTYDAAGQLTSQSRPGSPTVTISRTPVSGGEQVVVSRGSETWTTVQDRYRRVISEASSRGSSATYTYDAVTGLRADTSETFRGQTQTTHRTFTNTGDAAQVWINGQQRQSAARTVPPGNAWIGSGTGSGSGSMP